MSHQHHHKGEELAEQNKKYYDSMAQHVYQPQWQQDLGVQIEDLLLGAPEGEGWLGLTPASAGPVEKTRVLDYACGNGIMSRLFKPYFGSCIGIDVSGGMLANYARTAESLGLGLDEMRGARGNLLADTPEPTEPQLPDELLWNFDLAVISMALHHTKDPSTALTRLASRLKVGGTLVVVDWAVLDGSTPAQRDHMESLRLQATDVSLEKSSDPVKRTVSRLGFAKDDLEEMIKKAGCGHFKWKIAESLSSVPAPGGKFQLFVARATKDT